MPKIVDKEQRRVAIAAASKELLLQKGITALTVAEVAKNAGIGKGTIYQYFKSKEDIVFAIINAFLDEELSALDNDLAALQSFDKKLFRYFHFLLHAKEKKSELKLYLEYVSITIRSGDEEMVAFNLECRQKFRSRLEKIIYEAVEKKQIKALAKDCIMSLYALEKGFVLLQGTEQDIDLAYETQKFLNAFIKMVQL